MNKVCKHGLNDIWIDRNVGRVRICGWTGYYLGNLSEHTFEELWHGERAEEFRQSLIDGSYRFCNHSKCPYCANEKVEEHFTDYKVPDYPESVNLAYQLQCNYACKFCRSEKFTEKLDYSKIEEEINKILPYAKKIGMNGAGEFFCSESIGKLITENTFDKNTKFEIESNGSLFNEKNWEKYQKLGDHDLFVAITVHSFNDSTYKYLSGTTLPVKNIIDNLRFISSLRENGIVNNFEIATVVCERNFREIPDYVRFCLDNFNMDTIRLRFFEPYGVMDKSTEWFYDVRNKYHPYHDEFVEIMKDPILNNPKVWKWQGETESLQTESPYVLEHQNVIDFSQLFCRYDLEKDINKWLEKNNNPKIALYGASFLGKSYIKLFSENGLDIDSLFDTYAADENHCNTKIIKPSYDSLKGYDYIIITNNTFSEDIKEELLRNRYSGKVLEMKSFIEEIFCCD